MIREGYRSKATKWGNYTVKKVVRLNRPVECFSKDKGKALFNPTMVKLEWDIPPSGDKNEFWFPYWITWVDIDGKERYGQYSPMIGEKALLELLKGAIVQDFFSRDFLHDLNATISQKLGNRRV
jgi:hypothetical protein